MPCVAIHHSKAVLDCIVRQPSDFVFVGGSVRGLHAELAALCRRVACGRAV